MELIFRFLEPLGLILIIQGLSILSGWGWSLRLREDPMSRLFCSVCIGFLLMYLIGFLSYLMKTPMFISFWVFVGLCLISGIYGFRFHSKNKVEAFTIWPGIAAWFVLSLWITALQLLVVVYGVVYWSGDWFEHYERSVFFLDQLPLESRFLNGLWTLPARGPLFNIDAALLMAGLGREFWVYQSISTVLNTFPVIAFALVLRDIGHIREKTALFLAVVIFGCSLFAVRQELYTWNKFFTMGFILGAIHFYYKGGVENRPGWVVLSSVIFALGVLAHYLTVGFLIFFVAHYLLKIRSRSFDLKVFVTSLLISAVILSSWFVFCFSSFGIMKTLTANSTFNAKFVKNSIQTNGQLNSRQKIFFGNLITTTVPHSWRHDWPEWVRSPGVILPMSLKFGGKSLSEYNSVYLSKEILLDRVANQSSFFGALGATGSLCVLGSLFNWIINRLKIKKDRGSNGSQKIGAGFWLFFFGLGIPLNIFFQPYFSIAGFAHVNLHPFLIVAVTLAFRWINNLSRSVQISILILFLIESEISLSALLRLLNQQVPLLTNLQGKFMVDRSLGLNIGYIDNFLIKLNEGLIFTSDRAGEWALPMAGFLVMGVIFFAMAIFWNYFSFRKNQKS